MRRTVGLTLFLFFLQLFTLCAQVVPFRKGNEWRLYDKTTQTVLPDTFREIVPASCGLLFINLQGKWGAIDGKKRTVIPARYLELRQLNADVLFARDSRGIHLFDTLGKAVTKTLFKEAQLYRDDSSLIVVRNKKDKYGIIDSHGKTKLKFIYDFAPEHIGGGFLSVGKKAADGSRRVGLLDSLFHAVLPASYTKIALLDNRYFVCSETSGQYALLGYDTKKLYEGIAQPYRVYTNFILTGTSGRSGVYVRKTGKLFLFGLGSYAIWDENGLSLFNEAETNSVFFVTAAGDTAAVHGYRVLTGQDYSPYFPVTPAGDNEQGKWGMIDAKGRLVIPLEYDAINSWNVTCCAAGTYRLNEKGWRVTDYSLIDIASGKPRTEKTYEDIRVLPAGGIALKENGAYHLYDENLELQDTTEYSSVMTNNVLFYGRPGYPFCAGCALYEVKKRHAKNQFFTGYVDGHCHVLIPPVFREIKMISDDYNNATPFCRMYGTVYDSTLIYPAYGRAVLLSCDGKQLGGAHVRGISSYSVNNFIPVYNDVRYEDEVRTFAGLMDTLGNVVLPTAYDAVEGIRNTHYFMLRLNGKTGVAGPDGKLILPLVYKSVGAFGTSRLLVLTDAGWGIADAKGNVLLRPAYEKVLAGPLYNGTLFKVSRDKKEFYVDINGTEYTSP
ncbi:MAG TPA: WG repeat-containing protein [Bacteroidia bacterium]|nr:WG repeat-containing protein [Bacteroidia bacterium]